MLSIRSVGSWGCTEPPEDSYGSVEVSKAPCPLVPQIHHILEACSFTFIVVVLMRFYCLGVLFNFGFGLKLQV